MDFSLVVMSRGYSHSCAMRTSHCGGFSCFRARVLELMGFSNCATEAQELWCPGSKAEAQQFGAQAQLFHGMWDPPGPGIKRASPSLAGRLFITELPGKLLGFVFLRL